MIYFRKMRTKERQRQGVLNERRKGVPKTDRVRKKRVSECRSLRFKEEEDRNEELKEENQCDQIQFKQEKSNRLGLKK